MYTCRSTLAPRDRPSKRNNQRFCAGNVNTVGVRVSQGKTVDKRRRKLDGMAAKSVQLDGGISRDNRGTFVLREKKIEHCLWVTCLARPTASRVLRCFVDVAVEGGLYPAQDGFNAPRAHLSLNLCCGVSLENSALTRRSSPCCSYSNMEETINSS